MNKKIIIGILAVVVIIAAVLGTIYYQKDQMFKAEREMRLMARRDFDNKNLDSLTIKFSGEVVKDQTFEKEIGENLFFRLIPDQSDKLGWNITIGDKTGNKDYNFAVITPPFYGVNPIYIEGWHFRNADNTGPNDGSVNAHGKTREFDFVLNDADYQKAFNAVQKDLPDELDKINKGHGILTIKDLKLNNLETGQRAGIDFMKFDVELIFPSAENETANWEVYKNDLAGFTFKYPSSWEIRDDYIYETAGGAEAKEPTVILCDKKVKKDSMGDCMQINMPQAPSNKYTKTIGKNRLNLYTDDVEIVNVYEKVASSFKIIDGIPDRIIISSPKPKDVISSPAVVSGKAKGNWFFEGVFPVKIYDANDKLLGEGPVHFEGETWMTEEFVNFRGEIEFNKPTTQTGYIIFKNDNPSGLPEHDESFKLQINFLNEYGYAEKTLVDFFTYLKNKEYDKAVDLLDIPEKAIQECPSDADTNKFDGCESIHESWEGLESFSLQEERNNKAKVLENYAKFTKEATLRAFITGVQKYSEGKYILTVQFSKSDGSILVEGPCCGMTEEQMGSSDKFEYKVKKIDGIFKVITAPLYRP